MTIGQWFGKWIGSWLGTGEERPEGSISGSASLRITASGIISADSEPIIVGIAGAAVIRISGTAKAMQDDGGEFAAIARVHQSVRRQQEHESSIEANRLAQIAAEKEQQEQQKAEDERRTLAEERLPAEMVAQGAEMRRREVEQSRKDAEIVRPIDYASGNGSVVAFPEKRIDAVGASSIDPSDQYDDHIALIMILAEAA